MAKILKSLPLALESRRFRSRRDQAIPSSSIHSYEFGYTPAMRLAYLRQTGYDPLDLIGIENFSSGADLSLPFFPAKEVSFRINKDTGQPEAHEGRTAFQDWNAYRYKTNARLLVDLHAFANKNYPDLPLLLRQSPVLDGWWSGWDKTEKIPEYIPMHIELTAKQERVSFISRTDSQKSVR